MTMTKTLTLTSALAVLATGALAQSPIYGSWPPASDYLNTDTLPEAFEMISEATDGALQWELIAGGQLADGRGTLAAVTDDLMQGGLQIPVYTPQAMPSLTLLYSIVVPGDDPMAAAAAAAETVFLNCPSCLAEARDNNTLLLGGFASASYRLMCTSPVRTISDMEGLRIRATGGYSELAAMGGATPMSTTLTEAVGLLQRGGLDCLMATREWLQTYGYGEYAKYVTDLPLGNSAPAIGLLMNRALFTGLSEDEQQAMLHASAFITAKHTIGNYVLRDQESFENQQEVNGVELVEPDAELVAMVEGFSEADRARLIEVGTQLGVEDPEALIETYLAAVERWQGVSAELGTDIDAWTQRLWDDVFSQVDVSSL
ncbi:TRAP transporter substrate-binding protein DctP [Pararhodobacter marinus]|nr:TRAP transporter substrate-binding protein DctP [Pararhodobacter marinus]